MSQETAFGRAALSAYMKVETSDGSVRYYRVIDGENTEITCEMYCAETGEI